MNQLAPLPARMRPTSLDEYVGQSHLLGADGPLSAVIAARRPVSLLLWGPPGSGKTTLAELVAKAVDAVFVPMSAVTSGLPELREVLAEASARRADGHATLLFLDEIHRFDKRQQDALLPAVEDGTVALVGATTENPFSMVNPALLSRMRLLRLEPLTEADLRTIIANALADPRGLAQMATVDDDAIRALIGFGGGDARRVLALLEAAFDAAAADRPVVSPDRPVAIGARDVARIAATPALGFDASAVLSAMIKSIRGSDPDAALYYLACLLEAGTDPRLVARRLLISASEDIGNADPRGLTVAAAAITATEQVGMPEVQYNLAQAVGLLAILPKSDRIGAAYFAARDLIRAEGMAPVPNHLRASAKTYRNPHRVDASDQAYLPAKLRSTRFYRPSERGLEGELAADIERRRAERD